MKIGSDAWLQVIISGAAQMGIEVSADQAEAFALHARELVLWNRKTNLTAIVDPQQLAVKHFLDAIAPLPHLPSQGALIDIGTGGGFPGIPLKVMRPDQPMTLIDSSRKKISFVKHIVRQLGLQNIEALHTRAQSLALTDDHRGRYHVVVSRAVAEPAAIMEIASGLPAPGCRIIIYQGPNTPETQETEAADPQAGPLHCQTIDYRLPILNDRRKLVILSFDSADDSPSNHGAAEPLAE